MRTCEGLERITSASLFPSSKIFAIAPVFSLRSPSFGGPLRILRAEIAGSS